MTRPFDEKETCSSCLRSVERRSMTIDRVTLKLYCPECSVTRYERQKGAVP